MRFNICILIVLACTPALAGKVGLRWSPNPVDERVRSYGVYRRVNAEYVALGRVLTNQAIVLNVPVGDQCFVVTALNDYGESDFSGEACVQVTTPASGDPRLEAGFPTGSPLPPLGDYEIAFDPPAPLWDISGSYHDNMFEDENGLLELDYTLQVNSRGTVTGLGAFHLEQTGPDDPWNAVGSVDITGRLYSARTLLRSRLRFDFTGQGLENQMPLTLTARMLGTLQLDDFGRTMSGYVRGTMQRIVTGSGKVKSKVALPTFSSTLPAETDGLWILNLHNIQPVSALTSSKIRLGGTADIELSNGTLFPLDLVRGTYYTRLGKSVLVLRASRTNTVSAGIVVSLVAVHGQALDLDRFTLRCLGQVLRLRDLQSSP